MINQKEAGKVVIISVTDSFLAKSLKTKLDEQKIPSVFSYAKIKEIGEYTEHMEVAVVFMSEELVAMTDSLVFLKDTVEDRARGLILVGDAEQYDVVKKVIPPQTITAWYQRPVDIEALLNGICVYLDENTGEKRKKTILIVDDDITYMRTVYEWLKDSYHVGMAANGVQAIGYLSKNKADLVLLDYEMPIANGPQVLSMLKNDAGTDQIPVIFLTGHGDKESVMSVIGLKPVDYLLKTIDKATLLQKLRDFFGK